MASPLKDLISKNFIAVFLGHFFLFFSFFMLLPALPIYLSDELNASPSISGLILGAYTLAALGIRPFIGGLVDALPRRRVYLTAYATFAFIFVGYLHITSPIGLGALRFAHGLAFGILTIASNTIAIDTMPKNLIGTGIGIFGTTTALAMSIAPMLGLSILEGYGFQFLFKSSIICCFFGLLLASQVRATHQVIATKPQKFSWSNMVLPQCLLAVIGLAANTFIYGIYINHLAKFAMEKELGHTPGRVYLLFSIGLVISRLVAGKMIDRGEVLRTIIIGQCAIMVAFIPFIATTAEWVFMIAGSIIGFGYGLLIPAYQALFNNLAPITQRGAASSSFLTAFDLGIFLALFSTGIITDFGSLRLAFEIGLGLVALSMLFFYYRIAPHYTAYKKQG